MLSSTKANDERGCVYGLRRDNLGCFDHGLVLSAFTIVLSLLPFPIDLQSNTTVHRYEPTTALYSRLSLQTFVVSYILNIDF